MTVTKCVGTPPGRGPACPPFLQEPAITGQKPPGRTKPWRGIIPACRTRRARSPCHRRCVRGREIGESAKSEKSGCVPVANDASARRYVAPGSGRAKGGWQRISTCCATRLPAPPSGTTVGERCILAAASRCAGRQSSSSAESAPDYGWLSPGCTNPLCGDSTHDARPP